MSEESKFCEFCENKVYVDAIMCPNCGRQLEELKVNKNSNNPQVVINNSNTVNNTNSCGRKECDKWTAFLLCFFLGWLGAHKFYEGKAGLGILYIFTFGLFGIGWLIDIIIILCKPNPYYV